MISHEELEIMQARHPLLNLIQLLVEGLFSGLFRRVHIISMRDLCCAMVTLRGVGMTNEPVLNLFYATFAIVQYTIAEDFTRLPTTLASFDIPDNPARGFSLQPLTRLTQGPFREHLYSKCVDVIAPLQQFIQHAVTSWPDARMDDPLQRTLLRTLRACLVRFQEFQSMHNLIPRTDVQQLIWNMPPVTINTTAWYQPDATSMDRQATESL